MGSRIVRPTWGQRISIRDGALHVPDQPQIPFICGDGIGADITPVARKVVDAAVAKAYCGTRQIAWFEVFAGSRAQEVYGTECPPTLLPGETVEAFREYLVGVKGPLSTPTGEGIRSINVALRGALELFAGVRPVSYFPGAPSPLKHPEQADLVIFRENLEDTYMEIEFAAGSPAAAKLRVALHRQGAPAFEFPFDTAIGIKPISKQGSERLIRSAIQYALDHGRKRVTIVHKGNIMKLTEGAFWLWGKALAEKEFGDRVVVEKPGQPIPDGKFVLDDCLTDAFLQRLIMNPSWVDVVATTNLNGDLLSDAAAALVGGLGIVGGANINYATRVALFESVHGTAVKMAGQDSANPSAMLLTMAMMLDYLGWQEAAAMVRAALGKTILAGTVTNDFAEKMEGATTLRCSEFGDAVVANMG